MKVVTDLSKSFNPVPKSTTKMSQKSDKKRRRATNKRQNGDKTAENKTEIK